MRRSFVPVSVLVLLLVVLCLMDVTEGRRGGFRGGGGGVARGVARHSGSPRGLSGGTWAACIGSSLLAAAAVLL
ncbi:hypothetical protein GUJ93_ZPchr0001g31229 [Zizania palustris]|uniref:Uncharacterized protein n=1 Tax=Zizania palustris TaxID=103762 RepID=A0A8J5RZJ7_ZIZPA|nr:hypothetical protein GUJ93_ZPchr0001g31229 [Zizania palustris]